MTGLTEEALAQEAKNGSLPAFEELVRRFEQRIYAYCRYRIGHVEDARDLTQQTFIQAFRKLKKFRAGRRFSPWIYTIARNLCTDFLRLKRNTNSDSEFDWIDSNSPATQAEASDNNRDIWQLAQCHLSESEFTALWLVYQQGFSTKEAAKTLCKSVGATKVILSRARQHMREALDPSLLDEIAIKPPFQATSPNQTLISSQT